MTNTAQKRPAFSIVDFMTIAETTGEIGEAPVTDIAQGVAAELKKVGVSAHPAADELRHQLERSKSLGASINIKRGDLNESKAALKAFDEDTAKQRAVLLENIEAVTDTLNGLISTKEIVTETAARLEALAKTPTQDRKATSKVKSK